MMDQALAAIADDARRYRALRRFFCGAEAEQRRASALVAPIFEGQDSITPERLDRAADVLANDLHSA